MKRFHRALKMVLRNIGGMILGTLLGILLLWAVFLLPTDRMFTHVAQSMPLLEREYADSQVILGYPATLTGTFTDCIMLLNAIYENPERDSMEQIMYMYRPESSMGEGWSPGISLSDYMNGASGQRELEYARYWHGYLVFLKPLLWLTNVNSIRLMASVFQLLLVGGVLHACLKRKEEGLGLAYLFSVPFFYFLSMYASFSLSICFYILSIALLVQLKWNDKMEQKEVYPYFFLIVGMATAYFDFLTYPITTLVFPLCVCAYLCSDKGWKKMGPIVTYCFQWGMGYLGLWAMKWIVTDVFWGENIIKDAISTIFQRTGTAGTQSRLSGWLYVLSKNCEPFLNWGYFLLMLLCLGFGIWMLVHQRRSLDKGLLLEKLIITGLACIPLMWFMVTGNHSSEHYVFTCKNVAAMVFPVLCGWCYKGKIQ